MARRRPRSGIAHPLRDVLTAGDAREPVTLEYGVTLSSSTSPHRVVVQLADGTETDPLPYPAWWVPRVGDVVTMLRAAGQLVIINVVAPAKTHVSPHRHDAADIDGTIIGDAPTPPPPPPPPPRPPSRKTVTVQPIDMGSFGAPGYSAAAHEMRQGGQTHDAFWFYGNRIASARSGGTIISGTIYIARLSTTHGVNGNANVRLGTHPHATRQSAPGGIGGVHVYGGALARGQGKTFRLTAEHIARLNGGDRGLGLRHGSTSYTSPDYLRASAGGASGALSLTVET